jgi:hypothetical protein
MNRQQLFEAWAPAASRWSAWAKPVLFAQMQIPAESPKSRDDSNSLDLSWLGSSIQDCAMVVDLHGPESVRYGLALAQAGFRPVPLYNCNPGPSAAIDLTQLEESLCCSAERLQMLNCLPDAPPAFLLDARRMKPDRVPNPGIFDNRWLVFPQDFPSASFLKASGITRVIVLQSDDGQPADDLRHVLLRWQEQGLQIFIKPRRDPSPPTPIEITRPSQFRSIWRYFLATLGLRRNSAGGFGSIVPQPSSGGGFG